MEKNIGDHNRLRNVTQRIDYVDLAKGICIMLVVYNHVCKLYHHTDDILVIQGSFRMPLYFILSGLFFKEYSGFSSFAKRKVNNLIVPFFFFYVTLSVFLPLAMDIMGGVKITLRHVGGLSLGWLWGKYFNDAIWFLMALFMTNLIFYLIVVCAKKTEKIVCTIIVLTIVSGMTGCVLSHYAIDIPFYIDTAFTAVPLFCFGYMLRKFTSVLYPNSFDKYNWIIIGLCCLLFYIPYKSGSLSALKLNEIYIHPMLFYICGISGTIVVLLISKYIKKIPLVSYVGRYSIMILVTHWAFLKVFKQYVGIVHSNENLNCLIIFLVTMAFCTGLIPVMKKYIPQFTAQKDFLH